MNAGSNREDSIHARARVVSRNVDIGLLTFALSMLFIYVAYEQLNWISLFTARVLLGLCAALFWAALFVVKQRHAFNCVSCGLDLFKFVHEIKNSTWRYCPECACSTGARPVDTFDRDRKPAKSIASAYQMENTVDTTRQRAIRWRNVFMLVMGSFFYSCLLRCLVHSSGRGKKKSLSTGIGSYSWRSCRSSFGTSRQCFVVCAASNVITNFVSILKRFLSPTRNLINALGISAPTAPTHLTPKKASPRRCNDDTIYPIASCDLHGNACGHSAGTAHSRLVQPRSRHCCAGACAIRHCHRHHPKSRCAAMRWATAIRITI